MCVSHLCGEGAGTLGGRVYLWRFGSLFSLMALLGLPFCLGIVLALELACTSYVTGFGFLVGVVGEWRVSERYGWGFLGMLPVWFLT
jgi:hypothetical protein